jgi:lysophospholipase L1-like esterase
LTLIGSMACSGGHTDVTPIANDGDSGSGGESSSGGSVVPEDDAAVGDSSSGDDAAGDSGNVGAQGVQCGADPCGPPMSCCQNVGADAGAAGPSCEVACGANQEQLCSNDSDCQQSGTAMCVQGICSDMGMVILGNGGGDGGTLPGGPTPTPVVASDGGAPAGYPAPIAATYSKCQTTPVSATACAGSATGTVCIECLLGGSTYSNATTPTAEGTSEAGNYLVTVDLGGAAAGQASVSAESSRGLLAPVTTAAGQTAEYSFVVNVRAMEGQPQHAGGPAGYPGLDLFFAGPAASPPRVSAIGYALATPATKPIMVYIASDSTACDQTGGVYGGWGQMLPEFFAPPIGIANYANSGASSASFMGNPALWGGITSRWKAGDYVIIQFGHNDKGVSDATVQANLEKYVNQAKAANVTPILVSPPARVQFGSGKTDGDQSSLHAASAKAAALAEKVAYVDLTSLSVAWYNTLGSQAAALKFHAADSDATHTNLVGAQMLASLVTANMKAQNLPLAQYLR